MAPSLGPRVLNTSAQSHAGAALLRPATLMPQELQRGKPGVQNESWPAATSNQSARAAPFAMPLNKAAPGPKMGGYGQGSPGVEGPMGRNDGVLYGRMPGGENAAAGMWSAQEHVGVRQAGLGNGRMQGMPGLRPPTSDNMVQAMEGLQINAGEVGMARAQRPKLGEGERQEETDDDMFAMFRFKVRHRSASSAQTLQNAAQCNALPDSPRDGLC